MEKENRSRSGSKGSLKAVAGLSSGDEGLSLSNVSPESSEAGTLKKPRKFKPGKYIAKKLKIRKSNKSTEDLSNNAESGLSEQETEKKSKFSSPKLQRFNFVKRFSGRRSYQVTPIEDASGSEKDKSSLRQIDSLSVSEWSVKDESKENDYESASTEFLSVEENEDVPSFDSSTPEKPVTLESKKVELKITISGKKVERLSSSSPNALERAAIDKASITEPLQSQTRTDIILPTATSQVRVSTSRDQFFNVGVPPPPPPRPNVEQILKPINDEPTFAAVVKEGLSVQSKPSEGSSEVEKYLILTSSLNTIISAAKELEDLNSVGVRELKFPDFPELKIREEGSEPEDVVEKKGLIKEEIKEKSFEVEKKDKKSEEKLPEDKEIIKEKPVENVEKEKINSDKIEGEKLEQVEQQKPEEIEEEITKTLKFLAANKPEIVAVKEKTLEARKENLVENSRKIPQEKSQEIPTTAESENSFKSTLEISLENPLKSSVEGLTEILPEISTDNQLASLTETDNDSEEMKKQRKSKIPVGNHLSASSDDQTPSTVHTQEARQPYHLNLSSSSSEDSRNSPSTELKAEEIKFEVGTPVRPLRTSPAASTQQLAPLAIAESDIATPESIDDIFHSPKSEKSLPLESSTSRRRIAYVPQLTIYTPEEQELLKSNLMANADSFDLGSLPPDSSMFPVFDDSVENKMTGNSSPETREHLYKILVIGELGTGKTSFIKRYVHQFFSNNYRATIGVDFALKVLKWDQSTTIRLQLWDIAGQERFGNMTRVYYKEAVGAFIVFDVTRSGTFDAVIKWKQDLDSKVQLPDGSPIPCVLLANKSDQQQQQGLVTMPGKMDEYCKQNGFSGWFPTSAKENTNIEESANKLVKEILLNDRLIQNDIMDDRLVLDPDDANDQKKKSCSC